MTYASAIVQQYFQRLGRPGDQALDAAYLFEMTVLRDMLARLEVILEDEDVPRETAERVIRCMLYGSPSPAAAELRMREAERTMEMLRSMPSRPFTVPGS